MRLVHLLSAFALSAVRVRDVVNRKDVLEPVVELSRLHTDIIRFDAQAKLASAPLRPSSFTS